MTFRTSINQIVDNKHDSRQIARESEVPTSNNRICNLKSVVLLSYNFLLNRSPKPDGKLRCAELRHPETCKQQYLQCQKLVSGCSRFQVRYFYLHLFEQCRIITDIRIAFKQVAGMLQLALFDIFVYRIVKTKPHPICYAYLTERSVLL